MNHATYGINSDEREVSLPRNRYCLAFCLVLFVTWATVPNPIMLLLGVENVKPLRAEAAPLTLAESMLVTFTQLVSGDNHTCGLTTVGGVVCWGNNNDGQVGDGVDAATRPPVGVVGLASGVTALVAGGSHTCALLASGGVKCWGSNGSGQVGDNSTSERKTPVDVIGLSSSVKLLAAGGAHTCAILLTGAVKCWGRNSSGQLGIGVTPDQLTPIDVAALTNVTAITAGAYHTCALFTTGGIKCWGDNVSGQLGDGSNTLRPSPVDVKGLTSGVVAMKAGWNHTCVLLQSGAMKCWGDNSRGQLGDDTRENRNTPVDVVEFDGAALLITAGRLHTCALTLAGEAHCWGQNNRGQLGDGTTESTRTPVPVTGLGSGVRSLAAGESHTCAVIANGAARCWGSNRERQLGEGAVGGHGVPWPVTGFATGTPAIVSGRSHTCALTPARGVLCWGRNGDGQLGDGIVLSHGAPIAVSGLTSGVGALALGDKHTCALLQSGGVKCWGDNLLGRLGDGTTVDRPTPTDVVGLTGAALLLAAGINHTCVVLQPTGVKCWGQNLYGQLGDGAAANSPVPVAVVGLSSGIIVLAAGADHTCALLQDGTVKCWGRNLSGQLGDGSLENRNAPVSVNGLAGPATALATGGAHACALAPSGLVHCWGANNSGQLGNGSQINSSTPVSVTGLSGRAVAISAGVSHSCALLENGSVSCWGDNEYAQLGDGSTLTRLMPISTLGLAANILSLSSGGFHTCVLVINGRPLCWGNDGDGQLGISAPVQTLTPVAVVDAARPQLLLNYPTAPSGSSLTLIGAGLPFSSTLPLVVNGVTLTDTVQTRDTGEFIVYLQTPLAEAGSYEVAVGNPPLAAAGFFLLENAAPRPQEGGGVVVPLPAGIARLVTNTYFPIVSR